MYLITLLVLVSSLISIGLQKEKCHVVQFRGKNYEKQELVGSLNQPMNLILHKSDHLFFKYVDWNITHLGSVIKICKIINGSCTTLPPSYEINTIAYDRLNNDIFLGGSGIFVYNFTAKKPERRSKLKAVHHIFVHKHFFIIRNWTLRIYNKANKFAKVPAAKDYSVKDFFISNNLSIYFTNTSGLFKVYKPGKPTHLISKMKIHQIAEDHKTGDVFFATPGGIYMDVTSQGKLKKVSNIKRAFGIGFRYDKDVDSQLIYSDIHEINILKFTTGTKKCLA